jgi:transcriptional regulator with XRE-family HTH domain
MNEESENRLGPAVRAVRRQLGLTPADVSKRTGITASSLSQVEKGEASLTYDKLVKLSQGLAVDISEFLRRSA